MNICNDLICAICRNDKFSADTDICSNCFAFEGFDPDSDLLNMALAAANQKEASLLGRERDLREENADLHAKVKAAEARAEALSSSRNRLVEWIRGTREYIINLEDKEIELEEIKRFTEKPTVKRIVSAEPEMMKKCVARLLKDARCVRRMRGLCRKAAQKLMTCPWRHREAKETKEFISLIDDLKAVGESDEN